MHFVQVSRRRLANCGRNLYFHCKEMDSFNWLELTPVKHRNYNNAYMHLAFIVHKYTFIEYSLLLIDKWIRLMGLSLFS